MCRLYALDDGGKLFFFFFLKRNNSIHIYYMFFNASSKGIVDNPWKGRFETSLFRGR